ncbi:helix-turn-helix domain-containing protein [Micromonospora phytophila]|uniref:AraC-like ligand-binding domain-containing protein n=1 Tax=Micromonospora phytophila TaxID=709888 RepID=UPI0020309830|nr:helix-turn-helix domain-containing protein [Micromonospora phytophila]MCM0676389.1 helix-turn-helix domain-containing protein [Micromonospora phytophila]
MTVLRAETLDTTRLPSADRWPYFLDIAARTSAPIALDSDHAADFRASSRIVDLGGIQLTRFRYQSLTGQRTPRLIRQEDPELYQIALTLTGTSAISARRRDTPLASLDFTLLDWGRPHRLVHHSIGGGPERAASVTAVIPRALLPVHPDRVDRLTAARMSGTEGPGALLALHLNQITSHPEQFRAADAPRLADLTLNLVATLLAHHLDAEDDLPVDVRQQATLTRVRAFIDRHLGDPTLSPSVVAEAHHLSLRTLHRLFAAEEDTVAGLIRRRRLERCRRDLTDPLLRHQPVHRIARRWGFTDRAHFSRLFRAAYGTGPQAYRDLHTGPGSSPDR